MITETGYDQKTLVSFLLSISGEELASYLPQVNQIIWQKKHLPIIKAMKAYLDVKDYSYDFYKLVLPEYPDKEYLGELLGDAIIPSQTAPKVFSAIITLQKKFLLQKALKNLDLDDPDQVLKDIKNLKPAEVIKPSDLTEVKIRRMNDRELEKIAPSTGYADLDVLIKGFVPGKTYTMTGETNVGKTQIACNFAYRVAKQGKRVLYFALEPGDTLIEYLASIWVQKRFVDLTSDDLTPQVNIDVFDKEQVPTLAKMIDIVEEADRYDLIVIDHFGYFTASESNNKTQVESNAMKQIAYLAKHKKTAVLLIVHPRKPLANSKKHLINMNDISGSAAFKQDATDVLLLIRNKDEADQFGMSYLDTGYILVAKTKSGKTGVVSIKFIQDSALVLDQNDVAKGFGNAELLYAQLG